MSGLQDEYRKALARYPRTWRRDHEEALLGVLLDNAEAEGRHHMSKTDRTDLARNSRRLRVMYALPFAFFAVAGLALVALASLVLGGSPLDSVFLLIPPAIPAPPIGGSYQPLFVVQESGWALCAFSAGVLILATLAGLRLVRRNLSRSR